MYTNVEHVLGVKKVKLCMCVVQQSRLFVYTYIHEIRVFGWVPIDVQQD